MSTKLIFHCTHDRHDAERATMPFIAANVAATAGIESVVLCTVDGVWLGTDGGVEGIAAHGLPPLAQLYREFIDNGGQVWLCGACTKPRGITEQQLTTGASIVGAAMVIEEIAAGAKTAAFA
jgi:predicted peroxiredoxin